MTHGNDKTDFYVTNRFRTASGANDSLTHLIRHESAKTWTVYSSAHSSPFGASGCSAAGTTHTPDGASGWTTVVGSKSSRNRAVALARKTCEALNLGRLSK